jgi:anti-sigma factor RsiW
MSECPINQQLSAYLDGELGEAECQAIERHLPACAECTAALGAYRQISRLVGHWEMPEMSSAGLRKLHTKIDMMGFRRLERLAFTLSSMAAGLAIATVLWSSQSTQRSTEIALWEQAAIAPAEYASGNNTQEASMAQWVIDDLSSGGAQ